MERPVLLYSNIGEMTSRLRSQRLWQLLERFPRTLLHRIGRAARVSVRSVTYKHDVIEMLCALREAVLERALAEGLARPDLQAMCRRVGRADTGSKAALAARILAAMDEPAVQSPRWRPFVEARAFAHRLALTSQTEWYALVAGRLPAKGTLPADIPRYPATRYAKAGWTSWGDFLGTGNPARHQMTYRPFRQARAFARSLGLTSVREWRAACRARSGNRRVLPPDIPSLPERVYAGRGWVSYGDWLGTGNVHPSKYQYQSYEEACAFVRALGIRTGPEWQAYCRGELGGLGPRPLDIPSNPQRAYRGRGWVSWGHFFGTNAVAFSQRKFRSFAAARAYVRVQRLRNSQAWRAWCAAGRRPPDIPANPATIYRERGWVSWGDFLGTGRIHPSRVRRRSFAAMRASARLLGLHTRSEYRAAWRDGRIPKDIPLEIERHPAWKGWVDFLGPSYAGRRPRAAIPTRKRARRG
jgi:hypothetical protein